VFRQEPRPIARFDWRFDMAAAMTQMKKGSILKKLKISSTSTCYW
jgi:hypothetical protein